MLCLANLVHPDGHYLDQVDRKISAIGRELDADLLGLEDWYLKLTLLVIVGHGDQGLTILSRLFLQESDAHHIGAIVPVLNCLINWWLPRLVDLDHVVAMGLARQAVIDYLEHVVHIRRVQLAVLHVEGRDLHLDPIGVDKLTHLRVVARELGLHCVMVQVVRRVLVPTLSPLIHH
jgi:hypothetical protein